MVICWCCIAIEIVGSVEVTRIEHTVELERLKIILNGAWFLRLKTIKVTV